MNILVFGLGALGTVYAASLKAAGHKVYAITKERYLKDLGSGKVRVSGIWDSREAVLDGIFTDTGPLLEKEIDLVILTVKSFDTAHAVRQIKDLVKGDTLVLISQNGYGNYETASLVLGREHVLLARVIFGARIIEVGYSEVTVIADDVKIGQPDEMVEEKRIVEIADAIRRAGIPASYARDVYGLLWDKILYNCALNPLGAIIGCSYGTLADHEGSRHIMDRLIDEIFEVTGVHGIILRWESPQAYKDHFYGKLIPPTREHYPSMYYDINAGKRVEIDALNGAIVRLARKKGIQVPVNETITDLIRTKEAESLRRSSPVS